MDKEEAQRRGLPWLAEIGGYGTVAGSDPSLLLQPANAIRDALRRDAAGRDDAVGVGDLDLIEINVAFAGVALASLRDLGVAKDRDGPGEAVQDRLAGQASVEHSPGG
jgi:acetyl-CoA C-acetyltransferase